MSKSIRQQIVAGNWKLNGSLKAIQAYLADFESGLNEVRAGVEVLLAPPAVYLPAFLGGQCTERLGLAAQNVSAFESGAYTGEISANMVADLGVGSSLVGHSERRSLFGETDEVIVEKIRRLLEANVRPILCVGETLAERESGQAVQVVSGQIRSVLEVFEEAAISDLVVAYEPVWAIGTGKTATPDVAQEMHAEIRQCMAQVMPSLAERCPLLYGGSVNSANAAELFAQEDIDGGLVGGASLKPEEFLKVCRSIG